MNHLFTVTGIVEKSMIDHNQHMHDSQYNEAFSQATNAFNYNHGLSLEERKQLNYTIFTIEEHTTFLSQLKLNDQYQIDIYLYNYDYKRLHFFLIMRNDQGNIVATNEQMMMGIDRESEKSAAFPEPFKRHIETYFNTQPKIDWPKQLGHRIEIPQKGASK
ncbi:thioesterase family protein [Staphylococcus simulans]